MGRNPGKRPSLARVLKKDYSQQKYIPDALKEGYIVATQPCPVEFVQRGTERVRRLFKNSRVIRYEMIFGKEGIFCGTRSGQYAGLRFLTMYLINRLQDKLDNTH
jgi:hypothetical protein